MIRIAFIGEAPAVAHHGDDAGFGAVDEMRHHALAAVLALGDRDRHPGRGVRQRVLDASAGGLRQPQPVAGVADRARREMRGAVAGMREHRLAPRHVMRKAAAGQHHAAFGVDADQLAVAFDVRAAHRAVFDDQFEHRRRQPQRDIQVERRFGQPPGERVAIGQRHAAAVAHHVHRDVWTAAWRRRTLRPAISSRA